MISCTSTPTTTSTGSRFLLVGGSLAMALMMAARAEESMTAMSQKKPAEMLRMISCERRATSA